MPYDPRRSRPTPKTVPDEESAPIDALLGPSPDLDSDAEADTAPAPAALSVVPPTVEEPAADEPAEAPVPASLPTPVRKAERAPSPVLQLAPLLIAAAVVLIWLIRRRRR